MIYEPVFFIRNRILFCRSRPLFLLLPTIFGLWATGSYGQLDDHAQASGNEKNHTITQNKDILEAEEILVEIIKQERVLASLQQELASEVAKAEGQELAKLQRWQSLAAQFVFNAEVQRDIAEEKSRASTLLQEKDQAAAGRLLVRVEQRYQTVVENFYLIEKTLEAEQRAEQTRIDSKMYFDMRVRSQIPSKTLKAYGIMEIAKQERDQGKFREALELWDRAEKMVKEAFNEHIAEMAKWREEALRDADQKKARIRKTLEGLLKDHFVQVPGGKFLMGSAKGGTDETPIREVSVPAFKIGKTEVTFELYDLCVESASCFAVPNDQNWGRDEKPVINVSYADITEQFIPWLNNITGIIYRLPSEAEWEYAARAGSNADFTWGDNLTCEMARFDGGTASVCNARAGKNRGTAPVKAYQPNAFGIYDMHGNVWEWVEDCWNPSYNGAPTHAAAWRAGNCAVRVLRGGSWDYDKNGLRSANRFYFAQNVRKPNFGFRLATDKIAE